MQTKVVAVVPARSGSKGFVNKNIAKINGKTLIEYAVESGKKSNLVNEVYISTDSLEYESIAVCAGARSLGLRPPLLANDHAKTVDVILNLFEKKELSGFTHVVLLQPTSPIRPGGLIDEAISLCLSSGESVVSVAKIVDPHPFKIKKIQGGVLFPFYKNSESEVPRQILPAAYELTGAVYVSSIDTLKKMESFFSTKTQPLVCKDFVNIDSEKDYLYLQFLVEKGMVGIADED